MISLNFLRIASIFIIFVAFQSKTILGAQPNLILNHDIESGSTDPDYWNTTIANGTMTLEWTTNQKVSGSRCLGSNVTAEGLGQWSQLITGINPNNHYRFRVHVRASNIASLSHSVELQWFNDNGYLSKEVFTSTVVNEWQELKDNDIVPHPDATKVYILMRSKKLGTYYFDDPVFMRKDNNLHTIDGEFPIGLYGLPKSELIINGNADYHASNSTEIPLGWETCTGSGNPTFSWDSSLAYSGGHSLKVILPGDAIADWRQIITDINDGDTFNLKAQIYSTNVTSLSHGVELQWFDNNGYLARDVFTANSTNQWVSIDESNIVPPVGAVKVYILLRVYKAGSYNFDDVSLVREQTYAQAVAEMKEAGFNLYIDRSASTSYMGEMATIGDFYGICAAYMSNITSTISTVNSNESKPALRIWHGDDEPAWRTNPISSSVMVDSYDAILDEDDYFTSAPHAVWLNHAPRGTQEYPSDFSLLRYYSFAADIVSMDIYPVGSKTHSNLSNTSISCVGEYTQILYDDVCTDNTGLQDKVIWMVLQNFSWESLGSNANSIELQWFDNAGSFLRKEVFHTDLVNTWDLITAQNIVPPIGATSAMILLKGTVEGDFYFDDVFFYENGTNLLSNSDFETQDGLTGYPASWSRLIITGTTAIQTWDSSTYASTSHSVKSSITGLGYVDWRQTVSVDDNKTYSLSAYMKNATGAKVPDPTWTETRFMAYDAIINGARGLMYWGTKYNSPYSKLWQQLKQLATEISNLSDELVSPLSFREVSVSSSSIEYLLLDTTTGLCLIAANKTANTVNNVSFDISGLTLSQIEEYDATSAETITNNSFIEDFAAYEVKIWLID